MKKVLIIFVLLFFSKIAMSQNSNSLEGKKWILKQFPSGIQIDKSALSSEPFIVFETENKIYGNTSCNNLSGSYELSGTNKIKIKAASTRKMCPDMSIENALIGALQKANKYTINSNELILFSGKKKLASFEGKSLETTLELTNWNLTELNGKPAGLNSMNNSYYTVFFNEGNKVNAKVCNALIGNYEKGPANSLKIDLQISTMMTCPDIETEMLFKDALNLVSGYEIIDNKELVLKNGRVILARFTVSED